jgi:hypothetical protein
VEVVKSLKIKHDFTDKECTIFIKACTKDTVLVFFLLIAKACLEHDDFCLTTLKYRLSMFVADQPINIVGLTIVQVLFYIDSKEIYRNALIECVLTVSLKDSSHANELRAVSLYLLENNYNWFLDELRRQELIKQGVVAPTPY